ncbi:hypothetical protein NM688_g6421 [Phlebia brevispora]|uniref:Uncharacterized protein n=1 Tax=Phlebia brevispora TaxID=194682 RepID=A0ACC1SG54_9APHY|nr:hypothetical protein NM688_g6421 [Phlebia brevispora]
MSDAGMQLWYEVWEAQLISILKFYTASGSVLVDRYRSGTIIILDNMFAKPFLYGLLALTSSTPFVGALYTASDINGTSADGVQTHKSPRSFMDPIFADFTNVLSERELAPDVHANSTSDMRSLQPREVISPKITSPGSNTVWVAGTTAQVTWDTSNVPKQGGPYTGSILLGYLQDSSENEHLDVDHPLAHGFDLAQGSVDVKVPLVSPGNDYIIVRCAFYHNTQSPKDPVYPIGVSVICRLLWFVRTQRESSDVIESFRVCFATVVDKSPAAFSGKVLQSINLSYFLDAPSISSSHLR